MAARHADIIQVLGASFGSAGAVVNDLSSFHTAAFEQRLQWITDAAGDRFGDIELSLGVFAAGVDCLADAAAIGVPLLAIWISRRPPSPRRPDATTLVALVNAGWLLILSLPVAVGAVARRCSGVREVHG